MLLIAIADMYAAGAVLYNQEQAHNLNVSAEILLHLILVVGKVSTDLLTA